MKAGEEESARQAAQQLQMQDQRGAQAEEQRQQQEAQQEQRKAMVRTVLEPQALERLNRIGLLKPEKQRALEEMIIANVQRGVIKQKIDETTMISMLERIGGLSSQPVATSVSFKRRSVVSDDEDDIDLDNL